MQVEDALIQQEPRGVMTLGGMVPLHRATPSPALLKGQLMRYLAELPWAPDALLANPHLHWRVLDDRRLHVEATVAAVTGAITLELDDDGLPRGISGLRPALEGSTFREREWHGAFSDYREVDGSSIPHTGRVWWIVDGQPFDVWRGEIIDWQRSAD
ncbi:hypothetical protein OZN62_10230 [Aurantiacibacter sp. MUD11]|nr:DUF6544 family protein [Aurantiacibacter sp. MUD11]WAT17302.1 hypothetical protein OZN62_10230 [Aurantiacibacter sp. MUD11]